MSHDSSLGYLTSMVCHCLCRCRNCICASHGGSRPRSGSGIRVLKVLVHFAWNWTESEEFILFIDFCPQKNFCSKSSCYSCNIIAINGQANHPGCCVSLSLSNSIPEVILFNSVQFARFSFSFCLRRLVGLSIGLLQLSFFLSLKAFLRSCCYSVPDRPRKKTKGIPQRALD